MAKVIVEIEGSVYYDDFKSAERAAEKFNRQLIKTVSKNTTDSLSESFDVNVVVRVEKE